MRRYKMWAVFTPSGVMDKTQLFTTQKKANDKLTELDKQAGWKSDRVYVERAYTNGK